MSRLLILCEYPTLLGGERSMLATLPAIAAAGFDPCVASPPEGPLAAALRRHGVSHVSWRTQDERGQRLSLAQLREGVATLIGDARADLLHANSLSTSRIAGPVAVAGGVPSLGHLRDIVRLSRQAVDDLNAHRRLVAVSRATRDYHVCQGLDARRSRVVYNGVDLQAFRPRRPSGYLHRELKVATSARLVAVVGQVGLRKGTDVSLAAASRVASQLPDVQWLIVGERTSRKEETREFERLLHRRAAEPPLAGRVHFLGSRDDMPQVLAECTLLVHAARQEPLGRVLLEAAASGLAVVATDVGGTREIFPSIADGAVLVPTDDPIALSEAAVSLLDDDAGCQLLARGGRRRAEVAFDIGIAAQRMIEQYQSVLS